MARNLLITSLYAAGSDLPLRYYQIQKEYGTFYVDALLDVEAGIKAMLASRHIDEIVVLCEEGAFDERDNLKSAPLRLGRSLYDEKNNALSTYRLLLRRLSRYVDCESPELREEEALLPEETREKLARFIQAFQENRPELKEIELNRLFDALSRNNEIYTAFEDALYQAMPELFDRSDGCLRWVRAWLYDALKPSFKLALSPANEETAIRFLPAASVSEGGQWVEQMVSMKKAIVEGNEEVNCYVVLSSDDAADNFLVINLLRILTSLPKGGVRLKEIYTLRPLQRCMAGMIRDDTEGFSATELFHAIHAFLNYGKADQIVRFLENSRGHSDVFSGIAYAMRHVDVGLSMCNIPEVEDGILRLRKLFSAEKTWREFGYYGMISSLIAESIREDYGPLLEGDGDIPFLELVKWAYRHQFYQQTLTLIESNAPESLVNAGVFYYCGSEAQKEQVIHLLALQRLELKPYEYYKIDDISHYFIKNYDRARVKYLSGRNDDQQKVYAELRVSSVMNTDPELITGLTACDSMDTLQNVLYAYYHLSEVRNKISHADAGVLEGNRLMVRDSDESTALLTVKDSIDFFIASYEKAMAEVKDKTPQIVRITRDEVKFAANQLKSNV